MRTAKDLAKTGNVALVEEEVSTLNRANKNTAEWHLETAQRLVQTAEEMAREGQPDQVEKLVRQALRQLEEAQKKATDARGRAAAATLAGFIYERYLADGEAAIREYDAASQEAPDEAKGALEAAQRLRKTKENLTRKAGAGRG